MAAPGAMACTTWVSSTSSPFANHGDAEGARVVTTRMCAVGSWNSLSNAAMSWRMSLTGSGNWGSASSGSTTDSPAPFVPWSSKGRMPYATSSW